ncbi:hypothetical protein CHUAL_008456 [Chamberlinius hualienensis]
MMKSSTFIMMVLLVGVYGSQSDELTTPHSYSRESHEWENVFPKPSPWLVPPPWVSCPSYTYHLQCQPGEKLNCTSDNDCGYHQKCCPIVGGGVQGRPLNCCRSYWGPAWWWPTESPTIESTLSTHAIPATQTGATETTSMAHSTDDTESTRGTTVPWWWPTESPTTESTLSTHAIPATQTVATKTTSMVHSTVGTESTTGTTVPWWWQSSQTGATSADITHTSSGTESATETTSMVHTTVGTESTTGTTVPWWWQSSQTGTTSADITTDTSTLSD